MVTDRVSLTRLGPPLAFRRLPIAEVGLSVTVAVCGPQQRTSVAFSVELESFRRLRSLRERVSFAEPVIAPVHGTGTFRPLLASVDADSFDRTLPSRYVAGV